MALGFDIMDMIFSGSPHELYRHFTGTPSIARVQTAVENLERRKQERKISLEGSQKPIFENEGINEGTEVFAIQTTPSSTRNNVRSEDGFIKKWFKNKFIKRKKSAKTVYIIDTDQKLHIAAKNNDIDAIKMFIKSNYELNDEDLSKSTPLLITVMNQNFEAARLLNQAHINILINKLFGSNPSSRPWYVVERERVKIAHLNVFTQKMIDHKFEAAQIGKVLAELHCDLNEVVKFHNLIMTTVYLQSCSDEARPWISFLENNMLDFHVDHIRIVINYGPLAKKRKQDFVMTFLREVCDYQKTSEGRDFLRKLASWELIDEDFVEFLEEYLQELPKKFVKIILQHDFRKIAETKFGRDISRICFGNPHPKVIRLLKKEDINVDRRYYRDNTPLHIASKYSAANNIQILCRKNADPNATNNELDTPMTLALKSKVPDFSSYEKMWSPVKSIKYLLLAGADIIGIGDRYEDSFFGFNGQGGKYCYTTKITKLLIAQIAIYEVVGLSVEDLITKFMNLHNEELEKYFEECRKQLDRLKKDTSYDNNQYAFRMKFNILEILCEKPEKIVRYVNEKNLQSIVEIMSTFNRKSLNLFYRELLRQRVKDIIELHPCRQKAIQFVSQFTTIGDPNNLVVHKIVDYLSARDLKMFKGEGIRESKS